MRILLPTDFSENARNAVEYALAMDLERQNEYYLLHTFGMPYMSDNMVISAHDMLKNESKQELEKERQRILKAHPTVENRMLKIHSYMGSLLQVVDRLVRSEKIDLIVMGTKGATGLKSVLIGSNTAIIVDQAPCSVLVIPENARYSGTRKILFTADYKKVDGEVNYLPLLNVARKNDSEVLVLNVITGHSKPGPFQSEIRNDIDKLLEGIPHSFHELINSNIADDINEFAIKNHVDLVVTIPRSHNIFEILFRPSTSKKLVFHSEIPILILAENIQK